MSWLSERMPNFISKTWRFSWTGWDAEEEKKDFERRRLRWAREQAEKDAKKDDA